VVIQAIDTAVNTSTARPVTTIKPASRAAYSVAQPAADLAGGPMDYNSGQATITKNEETSYKSI
jgi:hypothetical protein